MKKLFIGGFASTGSRVIQMILERAGYWVGGKACNFALDFNPFKSFRHYFDDLHFRQNPERLRNSLSCLKGRDSWAVKHGHLMLCVPVLKEWHPDSEFVLTVRHPVDTFLATCSDNLHIKYGGLPEDCSLKEKVEYYGEATAAALEHTDYVFRLEDVCFNPESTIRDLLAFAEVDDDPAKYLDIIKTPQTIGRYKEHDISHPIIDKLGYSDTMVFGT